MDQLKNCNYCGEEIRLHAKKCKHCGEWLTNNEQEVVSNETSKEYEVISKEEGIEHDKPKGVAKEEKEMSGLEAFFFNLFTGAFVIVITFWLPITLAVIAFFTVPSNEHHVSNIEEDVVEVLGDQTSGILNLLAGGNNDASTLVKMAFNTDVVASNIIEKFNQGNSISYDKSWLWSTAKIKNAVNPQGTKVSFGIFGMVFTDIDVSDIDLVNNDWFREIENNGTSNKTLPKSVKSNRRNSTSLKYNSSSSSNNEMKNEAEAKRLNDLGTKAYQKKDYAAAISYYESAIEANSDFAMAYGNLGLTYHKVGRIEEAINVSGRAIDLAQNNGIRASANYNIGKIYEEQGDYYTALGYYREALSLENKSAFIKAIERVESYLK